MPGFLFVTDVPLILKEMGRGCYHPLILPLLRREYYNQGMKCLAVPSNAYFHDFCDNPFYQPFECIQRKYLAFNVAHMKIHIA